MRWPVAVQPQIGSWRSSTGAPRTGSDFRIELGDFRKLPGGIYNTSYIRQYARAIDYDETAILAVYHQKMTPPETIAGADKGLFSGFRPVSSQV